MKIAVVTNTTYKITLLAWVILNIVAGLFMLVLDFDLVTLSSLVINGYILFSYSTKSIHLKRAIKVGAIVLLAASLLMLLPVLSLGLRYGMGMIWAFIPPLTIMPLAGFYLYKGCNKHIQLIEVEGKSMQV
ncbi:hypothetical protein [Pontibacter indicus]|uniref:Uncharacterized protein n=1 Tax=Pontibacter indicus TaxID=1317125 RepID=A0A1R3XR07_9BACT|nr:hypothetical protein [Pontibacter indicus]SIT93873.1 hypothetical protein SAMN05444128_3286 [Pontibacter indicus]